MSANSFGTFFKVTTFGESHGTAIGGVIEGMPAGINFDSEWLKAQMNRRKPGQSHLVSARKENDEVEILSGIFDNQTTGAPIGFLIRNVDARSQDYNPNVQRVGHADDMWKNKFGIYDYRGGGRASARETATRTVAGAFARMLVTHLKSDCDVVGWSAQMGPFKIIDSPETQFSREEIEKSVCRFPSDANIQAKLQGSLEEAKMNGDSWGGIVAVRISNPPRGLGQPVFKKLKSEFASALLSIGAAQSFELGEGFESLQLSGNDFHHSSSETNSRYAGIRGGISTGEPIFMKIGFKPTSTRGEMAQKGRHDPCIIPRAVPVCEAMCWLVLADHILWARLDKA